MNCRVFTIILLFAALVVCSAMSDLFSKSVQTAQQPNSAMVKETPASPAYTILTGEEIKKAFNEIPRTPPTNKKIFDEKYYNVAVALVSERNGPPEQHVNSDRLFFIEKGSAMMRIGGTITDPDEISPGEIRSKSGEGYAGFDNVKMKTGSILSIPRGVPYQLVAERNEVSFIVIRMN